MEAIVEKILSNVSQNGGSMLWDDVLNSVEFHERAQVPNALKLAKSRKQLKRRVEVVDGQSALYVELWSE